MKTRIVSSHVLLWALLAGSGAAQEPAWIAHYDGPGNLLDVPYALAVDPEGNIIVTGESQNGLGPGFSIEDCIDDDGCEDFATVKYSPEGQVLWEARYDGTGRDKDVAYAAATDADGNVVVCGRCTGETGRYDSTTIKYSPDGRELWVNRHSNGDAFSGGAHAVVTDRDGNVYVRGISARLDPLDRLEERMTTIKYAADGTQVWANVRESVRWRDNDGDEGALAVDAAGNVHVTVSTSFDPARGFDFLTVKYSPEGTELWARKYDLHGAWETPQALAVDGEGNVVVTGSSSVQGGTESFLTVKYSPVGDELWARQLAGGRAGALVIDRSGNIFVTGAGGPIITVLYSPGGEEIWTRRHGEAARLMAIDLDGSGGVIVAGSSDRDVALARYSAGGSTLWLRELARPEPLGYGRTMRVDASGNMVLAGSVNDFVTASFRAAGTDLFRRGDVDENGRADMSDAIHLLETLFLGESFLSCPDAADSNDSGRADLSDAIHILAFLFLGGAAPPEPGPFVCGADATEDPLRCAPFSNCR